MKRRTEDVWRRKAISKKAKKNGRRPIAIYEDDEEEEEEELSYQPKRRTTERGRMAPANEARQQRHVTAAEPPGLYSRPALFRTAWDSPSSHQLSLAAMDVDSDQEDGYGTPPPAPRQRYQRQQLPQPAQRQQPQRQPLSPPPPPQRQQQQPTPPPQLRPHPQPVQNHQQRQQQAPPPPLPQQQRQQPSRLCKPRKNRYRTIGSGRLDPLHLHHNVSSSSPRRRRSCDHTPSRYKTNGSRHPHLPHRSASHRSRLNSNG
ncbi:hypothetical protein Agub_g15982, partial [Astrephomene gubernaculifera]